MPLIPPKLEEIGTLVLAVGALLMVACGVIGFVVLTVDLVQNTVRGWNEKSQ